MFQQTKKRLLMETSFANTVMTAILTGGAAWILFSFLLGRRDGADKVTPAELARMMRRYGIDTHAIRSAGFAEGFVSACRSCAVCDRKAQCREWLELSLPTDIPLFCGNEVFFNRVGYAIIGNPRAQPNLLPNRTKS
jgi:hypothetical protein